MRISNSKSVPMVLSKKKGVMAAPGQRRESCLEVRGQWSERWTGGLAVMQKWHRSVVVVVES